MRRSTSPSLTLLAASLLALSACKVQAPEGATAAKPALALLGRAEGRRASTAHADAVAADDNLNAVLWMQRWRNIAPCPNRPTGAAADRLDEALKEANWDALVPEERGNAAKGLKPAVVMDVDETVLDNSPYQARLIRDNQEYDEVTWAQWVAEKKAKALPGVVDFAKAADAKE